MTPPDADGGAVHQPRTVAPGVRHSGPVVRPRTIGALGEPEPIITGGRVYEGFNGPQRNPPTGQIPAIEHHLADDDVLTLDDPDIWITDDAPHLPEPFDPSEPLGEPVPVALDEAEPFEEPLPTTGIDADADAPQPEVVSATAAAAPSRLLRANLLVASGTAVSRLTGLVRTSLIWLVLAKGLNDAYIHANNTPNMIYELILGGILTAALVPLFTDDLERGDGEDATSAIISFALVALAVVTLVGLVAAPLLIHLLAIGAPADRSEEYTSAAVFLSLIFAPQIFFYGLMAVWSAVLNSRHRFMAAAWAPVLNNIIAVATLLYASHLADGHPTLDRALDDKRILWVLGVGTTLGIVTMALSLYPAVRRAGVRLRFRLRLRHPAVRRAIRLSGWTFGYVVANMMAVIVIAILAKPGTEDPTRYTTAYQFFQLPHSLLAVSIMVTFEPLLGRADSRGDRKAFNDQLLLGFRLIGLLIIPAAVGYVALPKGLDAHTFVATGELGKALGLTGVIAAFAVGLPGFSTYLYALRGFYAMKNTKIPFVINCVENAINIATAVVFVRWWGVVGLALSFALAYTVSAGIAVAVLTRHSPGFDWTGLVKTWAKLLLAAIVMGGFVYGVVSLLAPSSALMLLPAIGAGVLVGAATYFATIYALQVPGISELMTRLPGLRKLA